MTEPPQRLIMTRDTTRPWPYLLGGLIFVAGIMLMQMGPAVSRSPAQNSEVSITIVMSEFAFQPGIIRLAARRPVRLRLVNRGEIAHQFESAVFAGLHVAVFDGDLLVEGGDVAVVRLQPGAAATLAFTPRRTGRVPFVCTIEGHQEAGMSGILDVR